MPSDSPLENTESLRVTAGERALDGDYQGAIETFAQLLRVDPDDASVFAALALVYTRMGDDQNAIENFRQAAQLYQQQENLASYRAMLRQIERLE